MWGMHVAVAKVVLHLPGVHDLKGKRRVVRSVCARVRNRFDAAIAEVGDNELRQRATVGIAAVSNSALHASQAVDAVVEHIEGGQGEYEVVDVEVEVISGF